MVSPEQGVPRSFLESHRHDANRGGSQRRARRQRGQEPGDQMANVAVLLLRLHAKIFRVIAAAHAGAAEKQFAESASNSWRSTTRRCSCRRLWRQMFASADGDIGSYNSRELRII